MDNINFDKVFKYGFIASIAMIFIGIILKARMLIVAFELIALICGILLSILIITDLIGWRKTNLSKTHKNKDKNEKL
jgi:hypothetical protein